jgi:hypothetical protein
MGTVVMTERYIYPEGTERYDTTMHNRKEVYQNGQWLIWLPPLPEYVDGKLVLPTDTKK